MKALRNYRFSNSRERSNSENESAYYCRLYLSACRSIITDKAKYLLWKAILILFCFDYLRCSAIMWCFYEPFNLKFSLGIHAKI